MAHLALKQVPVFYKFTIVLCYHLPLPVILEVVNCNILILLWAYYVCNQTHCETVHNTTKISQSKIPAAYLFNNNLFACIKTQLRN